MVTHGLKKSPQLNGVLCIIHTERDAESGRHAVQLMDETTVFNIKTTNITLELEPAEVLKGGTSRWRWRQSIFTKDDCARLATSLAW